MNRLHRLLLAILLNEKFDRSERIIQKMRINLLLQGGQFCFSLSFLGFNKLIHIVVNLIQHVIIGIR
ncbi:hypothetical protein D3C74_295140 [compost metagenome]